MTTMPAPVSLRPRRAPGTLTGTTQLVRLCLRRDRIVLPLWVLIIGVLLPTTYAGSIESVYPTAADLQRFAVATAASPALIAMYGPIFAATPGAVAIWKAGALYTAIGVAVILTVIRHTRAEEESGRSELVDSTVVGRYAELTAAVLVAQLTASARPARGIALGTLGVFFALRAVGDAGTGTLSWLSPQGWSLQLRPFADERWWVLLLHAAVTAVTVTAAYVLLHRRDLGSGLLAERPGERVAGPSLAGPVGLAWRMHRGSLVAWSIALFLYGLLFGSAAHGLGAQFGGNEAIDEIIARLGGTTVLEDAFVALALTMLGIAASAYAISATLRLHYEETAHRAESAIAGRVGRLRWVLSHRDCCTDR